MKKQKIFGLSGVSIIACDCLQAVICIFVDLFFVSQILKNPGQNVFFNIMTVGIFYVVYYIVLTTFYSFTGFALKKINKSIFVSLGSILLTVVVLMIYLLGDKLFAFAPLVAVVYGCGFGLFSPAYNGLTTETISSKHQVKFFAVKKMAFQLTYIIFPVSFGLIIDKVGFGTMALIMLAICAALVTFSFLIKPQKSFDQTFCLRKFGRYLKENKKETKPLRLVYLSNFFRGASYDCFTTLTTILVIVTFASNTSLGMFQSIFTGCSLLTLLFYLKFYRKKRVKAFILPTIIAVACTIIAILCCTNKVTIVLFYGIYVTFNVILMSISDSRRSGVVRQLSLHSHILESNAYAEFALGSGRIFSSVLIVFAGLFDGMLNRTNFVFLKLALALVCVMYVMYGVSLMWVEKALIAQDNEFRQVHINEVVEKTED